MKRLSWILALSALCAVLTACAVRTGVQDNSAPSKSPLLSSSVGLTSGSASDLTSSSVGLASGSASDGANTQEAQLKDLLKDLDSMGSDAQTLNQASSDALSIPTP